MRVVPGCLCYPIRFSVHIWPLNQAVFGLAVSLPENNCLASIRTSTGFPPMTEISAVSAYKPSYDAKPYVKMGAPYFQIKDVLRWHGIQAFISNFGLSRAGYELVHAGDFLVPDHFVMA
ncbi:hypothetical protein ALP93_200203 [Pseudomonas syringae pv. helianthi]|nr:hypothetical protein ALP93_200203 [Pseudomonas syringae pv. helianthi]